MIPSSSSLATLYNWFIEFKPGSTILTEDLREGHPFTSTTEENISAMRLVIETDRRTMNYLGTLGMEILAHPPYRSDLTSCDFYSFPKIKDKLLGKRFTDAEKTGTAYEKTVEATSKCK
ncbi:Histone-lysine N-methyltransferase SETMAR [Eumeta japonica]|uniref:Histone-lysine N-methyltransferase SETMAR n=1 Tax=Eumeta variegata TaxID=151549 RepID=A0A4C1YL85_EUMVA|nr:Histone-lysine N-methyltransferase SETMAR [Eumeta japonica]